VTVVPALKSMSGCPGVAEKEGERKLMQLSVRRLPAGINATAVRTLPCIYGVSRR
jgi:hypothetical protein